MSPPSSNINSLSVLHLQCNTDSSSMDDWSVRTVFLALLVMYTYSTQQLHFHRLLSVLRCDLGNFARVMREQCWRYLLFSGNINHCWLSTKRVFFCYMWTVRPTLYVRIAVLPLNQNASVSKHFWIVVKFSLQKKITFDLKLLK